MATPARVYSGVKRNLQDNEVNLHPNRETVCNRPCLDDNELNPFICLLAGDEPATVRCRFGWRVHTRAPAPNRLLFHPHVPAR